MAVTERRRTFYDASGCPMLLVTWLSSRKTLRVTPKLDRASVSVKEFVELLHSLKQPVNSTGICGLRISESAPDSKRKNLLGPNQEISPGRQN